LTSVARTVCLKDLFDKDTARLGLKIHEIQARSELLLEHASTANEKLM